MPATNIGFIGVGAMGTPLARHLLDAGYPVTVWARRAEATTGLADDGANVAPTPAALAAAVDVILLCVTDTAAVESVVFGDGETSDGLIAGLRVGQLLVDHSTIDPLATQRLASAVAARGADWIDAPVSGGVTGAEAGELVVMAGGDDAAVARARPLLEHYARRVTHLGGSGSGQAGKVVNQMLIGAHVGVLAEAFSFAASFGVEAARLPEALAGGWADSAVLQNHGPRMAAAAYPDRVPARIMLKDLDIACEMGRATESPMPVTALVQQLYRRLVAEGNDDKGQIGLMYLYRQTAL